MTNYDYTTHEAAALLITAIGAVQVWTPWAVMILGLVYFLLVQVMAVRSRRVP